MWRYLTGAKKFQCETNLFLGHLCISCRISVSRWGLWPKHVPLPFPIIGNKLLYVRVFRHAIISTEGVSILSLYVDTQELFLQGGCTHLSNALVFLYSACNLANNVDPKFMCTWFLSDIGTKLRESAVRPAGAGCYLLRSKLLKSLGRPSMCACTFIKLWVKVIKHNFIWSCVIPTPYR